MRRLVDASRMRIPVPFRSRPRWSRRIPTGIAPGIGHGHAWVFMKSHWQQGGYPKLAASAPKSTYSRGTPTESGVDFPPSRHGWFARLLRPVSTPGARAAQFPPRSRRQPSFGGVNGMGYYQTPDENAEARAPPPGIRGGRRRRKDGGGGSIARFGQAFLQKAAGMAGRVVGGDGLRRALGDNGAAVPPTIRSEVDDPVGGGYDVEVVLDDDHRVSAGDESIDDGEQPVDVGRMKAGGRFVHDADVAAPRQLGGELEALRFAAREGRQATGRGADSRRPHRPGTAGRARCELLRFR